MNIEDRFIVPLPPAEAFDVLLDLDRVARCMPGAELRGANGDEYEGVVKVKIGPVTAEYRGIASFAEVDAEERRIVLRAKGRDVRGNGNAEATVRARLQPVTEGTEVALDVELDIKGRVAQFGRGVVSDVSRKLLQQFAEALERELRPADDPAEVEGPSVVEPRPGSATAPADDSIDLVDLLGGRRLALASAGGMLAVLLLVLLLRRRH